MFDTDFPQAANTKWCKRGDSDGVERAEVLPSGLQLGVVVSG